MLAAVAALGAGWSGVDAPVVALRLLATGGAVLASIEAARRGETLAWRLVAAGLAGQAIDAAFGSPEASWVWPAAALTSFYLIQAYERSGDRSSALLRVDLIINVVAYSAARLILISLDAGTASRLAPAAALAALPAIAVMWRWMHRYERRSSITWLGSAALFESLLAAAPFYDRASFVTPVYLAAAACFAVAAAEYEPVSGPERAPPGGRSVSAAPMLAVLIVVSAAALTPAVNSLQSWAFALLAPVCLALFLLRGRIAETSGRRTARQMERDAARLRSLIDGINDAVATEDLNGRILYANQRFRVLFGLREDPRGRRIEEFLHRDESTLLSRQWQYAVERRREVAGVEYRAVRPDGVLVPVECTVRSIESGALRIGMQAVFRDISPQRLIETSQRALAQRLEFFFSEMPLGCIIWNLDFTVQEWNDQAEKIFGWTHSEALDRRYGELLAERPDDPVELGWRELRLSKATSHQSSVNRTKRGGTLDCEWFHTSLVDEDGSVVAVASMVQDVTERRNLERQLLQAQKLEAVGTLAGGIAHDFNNLLTTILGNITLARMKLGPSNPVADGLAATETAAERAAELTQQLLRFSRKSPVELKATPINDCLDEVVQLVRHSFPSSIVVTTDLEQKLWNAEADAGQIQQVVMNLCVNARDAIGDRGKIELRSRNRSIDREFCRSRPWARPGEWIEIAVEDDGSGIDADTQARIFEPFFTTKALGKGTGLGLSTAYGIIKNHCGGMEVESSVPRGSTFSIFLPRSTREVQPNRPAASLLETRTGSGTILVADDEPDILALARGVLEEQGYRVISAANGQEAVDCFRREKDRLDLMILDLTMPVKTGWEAIEEIQAIDPDVTIILSSGYSRELMHRDAQRFLAKPYRRDQLLAAVRDALEKQSAPSTGT